MGGDKTSSSPALGGGFDHSETVNPHVNRTSDGGDEGIVMVAVATTDVSHAFPLAVNRSLSGATATALGADGHILIEGRSDDENCSQIATFRPIL